MTSKTYDLRPVGAEDRQVWDALWSGYLAFYGADLAQNVRDAAFAQLLSDDPACFHGLIAWQGDRAVGLVHWVRHPHMWRPSGAVYLQDLYTTPDARGMGVARALIRAVYDWADDVGCPNVYWLTQAENETARRLYDRVARHGGFIKYDRVA